MRGFGFILVSWLTLVPIGLASGAVIVVGPGQVHTQISAGIDSATDGDLILVKPGSYDRITISGKGISVVSDGGGVVQVRGIVIENIGPQKVVRLDGLVSVGHLQGLAYDRGLEVRNCAGAIRFQRCNFTGYSGIATVDGCSSGVVGEPDGSSGARIVDSPNVAMVDCTVFGGYGATVFNGQCPGGFWSGGYGDRALSISNSSLTAYDSQFLGGGSGSGSASPTAADAIFATNSVLNLMNVVAIGGNGGDAFDGISPTLGGKGGRGLVANSGSIVRVLDSLIEGGVQGSGWSLPGGAMSAAVVLGADCFWTQWSGSVRDLSAPSVVREGGLFTIYMKGEPGEAGILFASAGTAPSIQPFAHGIFLLHPVSLVGPLALGAVPGDGTLAFGMQVPQLPAGVFAASIYLQGAFLAPTSVTLTSWGMITFLDSSL
jgi:hypothetical protein